jgi:tetratricopeptide (TPR) repeat protein
MARDRLSASGRGDDPREDPRFAAVFQRHLEELKKKGSVDPDEILVANPDLGPAVLEDLETYIQLGSVDGSVPENQPLGNLGDYTLRRQIGRGGMGIVYEAWQNSMARRVALKVMPKAVAADQRAVRRFILEAQAAGKLTHPNIVHVHGMGVEQQVPYYAMDFVEGETLAQVLARIKDAEPEAETVFGKKDRPGYFEKLAEAFADVADGLQHAHSHKVIHRDIKPSNLILDGDGRLRILDFGLARLEGQESLTLSGDFLGTPQYMSPEQARRKKIDVDHRTDVYSLGATMYEAITGRPPFRGKDHSDTLSQIIERDPVKPRKVNPRVPKDLDTVVLKCLRKAPEDRYGTAEALGQDLRRFVRGDPIEARPVTAWEALLRRSARRKGALAVGSVLIVLIAALGWLAARTYREARLRSEASYEPRVRRAVQLLQLDALNRRAEAWEPLIIDRTGEVFRPGFPRDAFGRGDRRPVETAVEELEAAAKAVPRRPDAPYYLARALLLLDRTDDALRALDLAAEAEPQFVPALVLRADVLKRRGDRDAAKALAEQAEQAARGTLADAWLAARRLERRRQWQEARAAFDLLLQPESTGRELYVGAGVEARIGRAVARLEGRDLGGALADLGVARFLWPESVEPGLIEAKAYYLLDERQKAAGLLADLHEGARFRDDVAVGALAVYISLRDYDAALEWAKKLGAGYVREMMMAQALVLLGRTEEAEKALRAALAQRPGDVSASGTLANLLYVVGRRFEEAQAILDAALAHHPGDQILYSHRAKLLWVWGKPELAVETQRRCLDLEPHRLSVYWDLGLCLIEMGNGLEGLEKLRRACTLEPEDTWSWNNLGHALARTARLPEAIEALGEAIRLDPGNGWALWNRGQALERGGRLDEALFDHRQALRSLPLSQAGYADAGRILERQGKTEEALLAYVDALGVESWDRATHGHLTAVLRRPAPGVFGPSLDRLTASLEQANPKGKHAPLVLDTFALALALSPSRRNLDRALDQALRGVEAAQESPEDLACLVATLSLVLRLLQAERAPTEHRLTLLPALPGYPVLDGLLEEDADHDPERDRRLIEKLHAAAPAGEALHRLLYLEGRLLARAESHREAAEKHARLIVEDPSSPEPCLRLAECLRAAGDPAAAVATIEKALSARSFDDRRLWDLWLAISLAELKRSAGELLRGLPQEATGHAADLRWLLERHDARDPVRIDCGGKGFKGNAGVVWHADRFFTGGHDGGCLSIEIEGTEDDRLYQTERRFPGPGATSAYRVPVPPGRYQVTLHFAETWFHAEGMRRFDVLIEGDTALADHEPFAAGACKAHRVMREARVTDGILEITFVRKTDVPMLAGLEVQRLDP